MAWQSHIAVSSLLLATNWVPRDPWGPNWKGSQECYFKLFWPCLSVPRPGRDKICHDRPFPFGFLMKKNEKCQMSSAPTQAAIKALKSPLWARRGHFPWNLKNIRILMKLVQHQIINFFTIKANILCPVVIPYLFGLSWFDCEKLKKFVFQKSKFVYVSTTCMDSATSKTHEYICAFWHSPS